jgi:hypothetical protein
MLHVVRCACVCVCVCQHHSRAFQGIPGHSSTIPGHSSTIPGHSSTIPGHSRAFQGIPGHSSTIWRAACRSRRYVAVGPVACARRTQPLMFCASGRVVDRARRVHVRVPHPAARAGNAIYTVTAMPCPHCAAALGWLPQVPFPFRHTSALCFRPPAHPFRLLLIPLTTSTLPPSAGTRAMLSDPIDPVLRCRCSATGSGSGALCCCADCITAQCSPAVRKPAEPNRNVRFRRCTSTRPSRSPRGSTLTYALLCEYLLRRPGCLRWPCDHSDPSHCGEYCGAVFALRRKACGALLTRERSPLVLHSIATVAWCCSSRRRTGQARWRMTRQTHRRHRCACVVLRCSIALPCRPPS